MTVKKRLAPSNLSPVSAYPDTYGDTPGHDAEAMAASCIVLS